MIILVILNAPFVVKVETAIAGRIVNVVGKKKEINRAVIQDVNFINPRHTN